jgi:hypothetical protein
MFLEGDPMGETVSLSAAIARREAEESGIIEEQLEVGLAHATIRSHSCAIAAAQQAGVADQLIARALLLHGGLLLGASTLRNELSGFLGDLDSVEKVAREQPEGRCMRMLW